jgi:hypothetical protein
LPLDKFSTSVSWEAQDTLELFLIVFNPDKTPPLLVVQGQKNPDDRHRVVTVPVGDTRDGDVSEKY